MRVVMLLQSYLPVLGGAQRQVQRLGPLLREAGFDVVVVTRRPAGTPRREHSGEMAIRRVPGPDSGALGSLGFTLQAAAEVIRLRPDVVHAHDLLSPSTAALLATAVRPAPVVAKVLSTGPGGDVDRLLSKPLGSQRLRLIARRFAAFVALSGDVEAELAGHGVRPERIHRIPNGVDTRRFHPSAGDAERARLRRSLGVPVDDLPLWLYCGRFDTVKRLELLVAAMREAPGRLLLVGEGDQERRLRGEISAAGLERRVLIKPAVDDTSPLHRAADGYLSASSTEGMSGSVLEAMASALPVVAAPASGMAELLGGGAGVVLEHADAQAFSSELRSLAADRERARALGQTARARARSDLSLVSTAAQLAALYRGLAR